MLTLASAAQAQKITVQGTVTDENAAPLPLATVMLLQAKDSALFVFDRTNDKGQFAFKNLAAGSYLLKITYVGYKTFTRPLPAPQNGVVDLGSLKMATQSTQLQEVVVEAEKAPVSFKKDTIMFDADQFKTNKANATVEDVLKRVPGMEVDRDGTVRSQGEQVQRVTVNGKDFFGRDPKMATRNLPADALETVQVYDRKSDQAAFTGIDDGQREKTVNLKIKDSYAKMGFGNVMGGYGTNDRYESKLNYNRFNKTNQLSVLGMANNVNAQGFTFNEAANFSNLGSSSFGGGGGGNRGGGGGGGARVVTSGGGGGGAGGGIGSLVNFGGRPFGFITSAAGGVNFNQTLSKKTEANGSYFFNHTDRAIDQTVNTLNFLPTGNFGSNQDTRLRTQNNNHRANVTLDHKFDSVTSVRLVSLWNFTNTANNTQSNSQTFNQAGGLQNDGLRNNLTNTNGINGSNDLLFRHRFARPGRTISTNLTFNLNNSSSNGTLQALNRFYSPSGAVVREQPINQENTQTNASRTLGANVSYTEPLGGRKFLEINYNVRNTRNQTDQRVYDVNNGERTVNQNLTNQFNNNFIYHRPGFNFRYNGKKFNFATGAAVQVSDLNGDLVLRQTSINRQFTNVLPNARLVYNFSNTNRVSLDYDASVQEPSLTQLQPLVDNSDPLNIYVGNPDLRPEYSNRLRLNYFKFDPINFTNFFALINLGHTANSIVNAQEIDQRFVRTTRPINVGEQWNASANVNYGFQIKKLNSRFNTGGSYSLTRNPNLLNQVQSRIRQNNLGGNLRYTFTYKEILNLSAATNVSYQQSIFDENPAQNQTFLNQTYTAEANLSLPGGFRLSTDIDYLVFESRTTDFRQELPIWNASLSKMLFKNQQGELKLAAVNILDRAVGVSQQANINSLQQTVINSLGRYVMLSFTYSLNKFMNPMGDRGSRRGGGPPPMIRLNN
jgi:hypothetical protein